MKALMILTAFALCLVGCSVSMHGGLHVQNNAHANFGGLYLVHPSGATEPILNGQTISYPWSKGNPVIRYTPEVIVDGYVQSVEWYRAGKFAQRSEAPCDFGTWNNGSGSVTIKAIVSIVSKEDQRFLREKTYEFTLNLYADTPSRF